jgi:hypothetical protein
MISVSMHVLTPLEEMTMLLDASKRFEIKPGQAHKVTIRRSRGFPRGRMRTESPSRTKR